jgi:iron-sulfur cluster assembly accessory protein|tara:strand:+ start:475 stop:804 length:330 start_codon:yes stop_codon:yes gene_type:complete
MINLTENAIDKLKTALDPTDYVRIGVVSGGCSGFSYSLAIEEDEDKRENDIIVELQDVKICMDPISANMLSETIIDYVETLASSGFKFDNQKADRTCGCGTSFSQGCPK